MAAENLSFAVAELEHDHIFGMTQELLDAGATLKYVYDRNPAKIRKFLDTFPQAEQVDSIDRILHDESVKLVTSAGIPSERAGLGKRVLTHGKDYFVDKTAFVNLEQLEEIKHTVSETGKKFLVYLSGQFANCTKYAKKLIDEGNIGRVVQVISLGPHRLNEHLRPAWFFKKEQYGGILCDLGTHQIAEFLYYAGASDAEVLSAQTGNFNNPKYPELEDFGDATLIADNKTMHYMRVDWLTPDGLRTWGDDRSIIMGTDGYMELRKNVNVADEGTELIYLVTKEGERRISAEGMYHGPVLSELVADCINRTENSLSQEFVFKVSELAVKAQMKAARIT